MSAKFERSVARLRLLLEKATPGPYMASHAIDFNDVMARRELDSIGMARAPDGEQGAHDVRLLAAAANALPKLLDRIEELKRENQRLEASLPDDTRPKILVGG